MIALFLLTDRASLTFHPMAPAFRIGETSYPLDDGASIIGSFALRRFVCLGPVKTYM